MGVNQCFWKMKNRNLFIQLNHPQEKGIKETLVNSWTRPPPMEYHLLHSPILTHELAQLVPKEEAISIFDANDQPSKCIVKKKGKERLKYIRLQEQLHFLRQFLEQFKDLHESQLLLYKQTLLVKYLNKFLEDIKIECHEKSHFLQSIWNTLIKIFQSLFERVVGQSKKKEKSMLTDEIHLHHQYQKKIQELLEANKVLMITENKYKGAISQLMDSVAAVNMELKGTKSLQEKSANTVKQLNLKYQELRSQYLDIVVSTGITREEAQANLSDRQLILFSRHLSNKEASVKIKAKQGRKARMITENIDVGLILEQIQAEEEYDFQINCQEKKKEEIMYSNQRVQTDEIQIPKRTIGTHSSYIDLMDLKIIKDKGIQTGKKQPIFFVHQQIQTDETLLKQKEKLGLYNLYCLTIKQEKSQIPAQLQSIKLLKQTSASEPSQTILLGISDSIQKNDESFDPQSFHGRESIVSTNEKKVSKKSRQSKMFRVGQGSRVSKMFPQKRLRTEGRQSEMSNSEIKRSSETKKVSQFILLEDIRKSILVKWNKFKSMTLNYNFFSQIKQEFSTHLGPKLSIKIVQIESSVFGRTSPFIQNIQLYRTNYYLSQKLSMGINNKKGFIAGKSMRIVADIFQNYQFFMKEGIHSLNLATFAMEYLSALKGQFLDAQSKEKIFLDFIKSCMPLSVSSYLVKNFFLLCGFPLNKSDRERRISRLNSKIKETEVQQADIKYMYSSQVYAYFRLLTKANCDSSSDFLHAYTTAHVLIDSLQQLKKMYKNSDILIEALQQVVKKTIQNADDPDPKLDIYKVLQFVIEKILSIKRQIAERFEPLAILYGELDNDFFFNVLSMLTQNPQQILIGLRLHRVCYGGLSSLQNISSMILIQGLQLDLLPFAKIQNDYKYSIMKKAICDNQCNNKMMSSMITAMVKKQLKKMQFLCLLKLMWVRQAENIEQTVIGQDLLSLYEIGLGLTLNQPSKDNFHWVSYGFIDSK